MRTAIGMISVGFGGLGLLAQVVSAANFGVAQRWGLQEKDDATDPLHRRLEWNTAVWDLFVIWLAPVAGILMLLDHQWWPFIALCGGAVYFDTGGREFAKLEGLRREGVRVGGPQEVRVGRVFLGVMVLFGAMLAGYAFVQVT